MIDTTTDLPKRTFPWHGRAALVLAFGCAVGLAAVVPYQAALLPSVGEAPISLPALALISALQGGPIMGLLAWIGLLAGQRVGLGAPLIEAWARREPLAWPPRRELVQVVGIGFILAALIGVVDVLLIVPQLPAPRHELTGASPLYGLLASLYGSIDEEVMLRLFLTSVLAWLFAGRARRRGESAPRAAIVSAIVVAAFCFGVGHLPAAAGLWELTPGVVTRVVALNMALGVPFGLIYWKRGLEQAMLAHFAADLALHVVLPLVWS